MSSTTQTTSTPTTLTTLPGELRNEIFNLCITQALTHSQYRSTSPFTGTVFSRHPKTGYLKLSHVVNPLPLVLVNRQTCIEVFSLLYARVECIELGDGVSVWLDDDAVERFNFAYQILERAGCVMKMVKSIEIVLPRTPCFQHVKTYASLMKMELKKGERKSNAVGILRGLDVFLRRFGRLESVKIVLTAEPKDWPPAYEEFLGVWGVVGGNLTVDYKTRMNQWEWGTGGRASAVDLMHRDWRAWKDGWEQYVKEREEIGREECEDERFKESS